MNSLSVARLKELAQDCVENMGDVFWDYNVNRDSPLGYSEPSQVAMESVEATLRELVEYMGSDAVSANSLVIEHRSIVDRVGKDSGDMLILAEIVDKGDLSLGDASAASQLARSYGARLLRHAVALAEALEVEGRDETA